MTGRHFNALCLAFIVPRLVSNSEPLRCVYGTTRAIRRNNASLGRENKANEVESDKNRESAFRSRSATPLT